MTDKIKKFIAANDPPTPCVIIDVDIIAHNYHKLKYFLPEADVFYAVKANPGNPVIERLESIGCNFDVASIQELDMVMSYGATPERISFGNTIKKEAHIKYAYDKGIRLFVFDSEAELEKIARAAPGSQVFCRILWMGEGAEWPLSRKFGCDPDMAVDLLIKAKELGLQPYGVSFHPGSQQKDLNQWDLAITKVAEIFRQVDREADIELKMVNMGGGFPASGYRSPVQSLEAYADVIRTSMQKNFGDLDEMPRIIVEPGRSLVGESGIIRTEVVLISKKVDSEFEPRWVYLDIGKFTGLVETFEEAITYRFKTPRDGDQMGPVILAGPTCDSLDILYEKTEYQLPFSLKIGDKLEIVSTGAYTTSYSSVAFNGFPPPDIHFI
jgi:ornithine decarboxylase